MKTFPEKLKKAPSVLGMSQEELAVKTGVSRRSVISYEKGEKYPRERVILKLAAVLGVSSKYLKDESCLDCLENIELDERAAGIADRYSETAENSAENLLIQNLAFFAGDNVSMAEKTEFFEAVMNAYVKCREEEKKKS